MDEDGEVCDEDTVYNYYSFSHPVKSPVVSFPAALMSVYLL
jgi:hypothetical protein